MIGSVPKSLEFLEDINDICQLKTPLNPRPSLGPSLIPLGRFCDTGPKICGFDWDELYEFVCVVHACVEFHIGCLLGES